jgi:hypothetical protein
MPSGILSGNLRSQGDSMPITFQKRQKEMKRMEKQRAKMERRAQKKLAKGEEDGPAVEGERDPDIMGLDEVRALFEPTGTGKP